MRIGFISLGDVKYVQLRRASGSPEVRYPGKFKSMARNDITYKLYKLMRAPALESEIATCYEVKAVECAKEVKRLLNRKGIKARFIVEYPDVYVIRLNDGNMPEWFLRSFSEIQTRSVREVLGFDEGDLHYRFGGVGQSKSPYDVLRRKPYRCPALRRLSIEVYYERPEYWEALESLFNRHVDGVLQEFVELVPKKFKGIWDLDRGGVKLALLDGKTLESRFREIAEIKSRSYNGLSTLQLVNGDRLLGVVGGRGEEYYIANLLSGLLFRSGCIPYYVELPTTRSEYLKLPRALYVGVGLRKVGEEYAKGIAVLMTGRGNVVGYVDKDFHIRGRSMEFKEEELEEFVGGIKEALEKYRNNARENPELVVAVRSRKFHDAEWRTLKRNFARRWLRLSSGGLLLMSSYKYVGIGPSRAVEVGRTMVDGGLHGVWLVQLSKFKSAVKVSYFYTGNDATLPLAAYIYLRSLDFTSLTQARTSLPPVKYARNYLRWKYPS
jgi:hypothetical protein